MKYRFYRTEPITEETLDPIQAYFYRLDSGIGRGTTEEYQAMVAREKEKYRTYAFVKYPESQKRLHLDIYGFVDLDTPFPVNLFGGPGWSEMVVVM